MKRTLKETLYIFISLIISFFVYRFITLDFLDYIPFNINYRSLVYIGTILYQSVFIYIIIKSIINRKISSINKRILCTLYFLGITFLLFGRTPGVKGINLNLLIYIKEIFNDSYNIVIALANILMFLPFGYLLRNKKSLQALCLMCILLLSIESLQYFLSLGMFDLGDIFLNIISFYLGFLIFNNEKLQVFCSEYSKRNMQNEK